MDEMWLEYKRSGDKLLRNKLMVRYLSTVKHVASRLANGLPSSVSVDDLESYGTFGLIDAIEKFDPGRGFKFETYAVPRIRGAIIDELRSADWVPRSARARMKAWDTAVSSVETNGETIDHGALAEQLGLSDSQYRQVLTDISSSSVLNIHATYSDDSESITVADVIQDTNQTMNYIELDDVIKNAASSIQDLPDREKIVITLYYYENLTLAEIGKILGVTESRVCQIHTKACRDVRPAA